MATDLPKTSRIRGRPGLILPNSWHAPLLLALSASQALLLQDYGCVESTSESDRLPAPLSVSIALPFVQPSVGSRNSPPPLSTVTLPQLRMLFQSAHEDRQAEALAEPGEQSAKSPLQHTLTAHIMGRSLGQARGGTHAHQFEAVDWDVGVAVSAAFS